MTNHSASSGRILGRSTSSRPWTTTNRTRFSSPVTNCGNLVRASSADAISRLLKVIEPPATTSTTLSLPLHLKCYLMQIEKTAYKMDPISTKRKRSKPFMALFWHQENNGSTRGGWLLVEETGKQVPRPSGVEQGERWENGKPYQRHCFPLYMCLGMWESSLILALTPRLCHPESN